MHNVKEMKNPKSSSIAENMEMLSNNSYGYQMRDRSQYTVTKFLNDGKTHSAKK